MSVAPISITPRKALNQSGFQPAYTMPWLTMPNMKAPKTGPIAEP